MEMDPFRDSSPEYYSEPSEAETALDADLESPALTAPDGWSEDTPDSQRVELSPQGKALADAVLDPDRSRALYDASPVAWLRGAIGVDTARDPFSVSDAELAERYTEGGFAEWDPQVVQSVRDYLQAKGHLISRQEAIDTPADENETPPAEDEASAADQQHMGPPDIAETGLSEEDYDLVYPANPDGEYYAVGYTDDITDQEIADMRRRDPSYPPRDVFGPEREQEV
jgi:hypothetical protein